MYIHVIRMAISASGMTYIVSGGALNSTHSLTAASNTVIGDVTNLVIHSVIPTYNIPVLILHSNLIKKI